MPADGGFAEEETGTGGASGVGGRFARTPTLADPPGPPLTSVHATMPVGRAGLVLDQVAAVVVTLGTTAAAAAAWPRTESVTARLQPLAVIAAMTACVLFLFAYPREYMRHRWGRKTCTERRRREACRRAPSRTTANPNPYLAAAASLRLHANQPAAPCLPRRAWLAPLLRIGVACLPSVRRMGLGAAMALERPARAGAAGALLDLLRLLLGGWVGGGGVFQPLLVTCLSQAG